jgi:uncharacterized protein involved in exopolysaccharide biosynthesis
MNPNVKGKEIDIYDYLRTLYKWRKVAVASFVLIVGTVAIASFVELTTRS